MSESRSESSHALLGRPFRLDRRGIVSFLRGVAADRRGMLELRRLLAEELRRSSIHHLRDDMVIEQLADRYVRGSLHLVLVHPREVNLDGYEEKGAATTPLPDQKNKAGDLKPAPEIPPEYPVLARVEANQVIDSTLKLVAELAALLFSSFARDTRESTLARNFVQLSDEEAQGVGYASRKLDIVLGLELHPEGTSKRPDEELPEVYLAAATETSYGPRSAAAFMAESLMGLARVDHEERRFGDTSDGGTKSEEAASKKDDPSASAVDLEFVDDGDPPKPVANTRYRLLLADGRIIEGQLDAQGKARVEGIPKAGARISFPDLDASHWELI